MAFLSLKFSKLIKAFILAPLTAASLFAPIAAGQSNNEGWEDLDTYMTDAPARPSNEVRNDGSRFLGGYESFPETQSSTIPQNPRSLSQPAARDTGGWQDADAFLDPRESQNSLGPAKTGPRNLSITAADDIKADAARALLADKRLRSGDTIYIDVVNVDSITGTYRVSSLGTVVLPLLGSVNAAGLEADVLAGQLEQLYAVDYLVNPKITVTPRARVIGTAMLKGLVNRQGPLEMTAVKPLADILADAGGVIGARENLDAIILRSVDIAIKARRVPLRGISPSLNSGPTILPGDQITILKREKLPVIKDDSGQFPLLDRVLNGEALRPY